MDSVDVPIEVWVIFPKGRKPETDNARDRINKLCLARGWEFQSWPSRDATVNPAGRKRSLLAGDIAHNLYRRLHFARVATLSFESVAVCIDPMAHERTSERVLISLREFTRYKTFYYKIASDPTDWLPGFEQWCGLVDCSGEHDPRCLPLHVFKAEQVNLEGGTERELFGSKYGPGSIRVDDDNRQWQLKPREFHGRDIVEVAGCALGPGFHWEVGPLSGSTKVTNTVEAWHVPTYINVYPTAHLRGRAPYSRKIFPRK
jgi:hypothetical protein